MLENLGMGEYVGENAGKSAGEEKFSWPETQGRGKS
jgi:hypothetical protein